MASDPRVPPLPRNLYDIAKCDYSDIEMRRMFPGNIASGIPDEIRVGNEVITGEDVSSLKDMCRFLRYLIESDPAMKERFTAFRTMQKIMK